MVLSKPHLLVSYSRHLESEIYAHASVPLNHLIPISVVQWPVDEFFLNFREDLGLELLISIGKVNFGNTLRETKCMLNCEMYIVFGNQEQIRFYFKHTPKAHVLSV